MSIADNLQEINSRLTDKCRLVAVSKTKPASAIQEAYEAGQRIFGENRPQEMQGKAKELPENIDWHMIGHLQSNKVKYIAPFVHTIHSVDKLSLLEEINRRAAQHNRTITVLLQMHIAEEESKFGMNETEATALLNSAAYAEMQNIEVVGVMGMATFTEDKTQIREEFKTLKSIFDQLKMSHFLHNAAFKEISMGMSGDFEIAMEEGSTLVRVGSSIFGARG